jgi:hypothetical protein
MWECFCLVRLLAVTPNIMTEVYYGFPPSLQADTRTVPEIRSQPLALTVLSSPLFIKSSYYLKLNNYKWHH